MRGIYASLIRTTSFLRKEEAAILRQPLLIAVLILGPFLILLLFGLGYRNVAPQLRALFVIPEDSPWRQYVDEYTRNIIQEMVYMGIEQDLDVAVAELRRGQVDVVIQMPIDALAAIEASQQAAFMIYDNEIDPLQTGYIQAFGRIYVNEVNRRVWQIFAQQAQDRAGTLQDELKSARQNMDGFQKAVKDNNPALARLYLLQLDRNIGTIESSLGLGLLVLTTVSDLGGGDSGTTADASQALARVHEDIRALLAAEKNGTLQDPSTLKAAQKTAQDLPLLEAALEQFRQISPNVLVSPFRSIVKSVAPVQPATADYYAPAAIVLLMQHLSVTFAALSIVQEERVGAMELFRVSPLGGLEILAGKYLSYILFSSLLAVILSLLMVYILGVPMLGRWSSYALAMGLLIAASLGIGFLISLISKTTTQAVQYSMLVLLTSVFFSGFFLNLQDIWAPVRNVSWSLPATYGILLLQDIMIRGDMASTEFTIRLAIMAAAFFLVSIFVLHRKLSPH